METAMPSIVTMAVAVWFTLTNLADTMSSIMVRPTPTMPVISGMNAATMAPKAMIITTKAMAKPIISALPGCSWACITPIVASTCRPWPRCLARMSVSACLFSGLRSMMLVDW